MNLYPVVAFRPHFEEVATPEPSLRELVFAYYDVYFDKATAEEYTDRYFKKIYAQFA